LRGPEVTLRKGWDLQIPISLNIMSLRSLLLKLIPCKIPKEAEISDLPIKTSVINLSNTFVPKLEDEEERL